MRFSRLLVNSARGLAFFLASYCLLSLLAYLTRASYNRNIWWIDISFLPPLVIGALQLALIVVLLAFVLRVPRRLPTRLAGAALCLLFMVFALLNVADVYRAVAAGSITLGFLVPFSLFIALAFAFLALAIFLGGKIQTGRKGWGADQQKRLSKSSRVATVATIVGTLLLLGLLFPLGQILCFGTTTYHQKVDACVVLGAQVMPNGDPSSILKDRLDTAIRLYQQGDAGALVMSGGIDIGGISEAEAMRDYAQAAGVPAADILVDAQGDNTQATARDTVQLMREQGYESVAAVSNFFHLARVKMLFLAEGADISTVPSVDSNPPFIGWVLREVPGWWYYWFITI